MKTFKFLMPFMLAVLVFAGCDTDDLRNDIDDLKNRVESLEAQVASINENMNALRVLIDGNKTISSYTYDETTGAYTLTLSDGNVITLTQGVTGTVNYPSIGIDENGNWTVNGESLGQPAVGQNGATPEFRIEESTNYWQVKFGAGEWQYVVNSNGENVQATTETINTGDQFFKSVEAKDGYLVVVLNDENSQTLKMPIVDGLTCEIVTEGVEGFSGNVLSVAAGTTVKLNVNITGDNRIVTAPNGWIATLSEPVDGKAELSLTAPVSASASTFTRATADNTKDVVVQANKGINWAVDKIQVQIDENEGGGDEGEAVNYLEKYNSGETITIAGVEINKEKFGEAQHVTDANFAFTADHVVYFIDPSVEVNYSSTVNFPNLILIGTNSSQKSKLTPTKQIKISNDAANGIFLISNMEINAQNVMNANGDAKTYLLTQNGNSSFGQVIFDNVKFLSLSGQPLTYISRNDRSISNLTIQNSSLEFSSGDQQQIIISVSSSTATYPSINLVNNVFYSKDSKALLTKFRLFQGKSATISNLKMHNNTFVNIATDNDFYVCAGTVSSIDVTKNLYYTDAPLSNNCGLIKAANAFPTGTFCDDNIVYKVSSEYYWQVFFGGMNKGFDGAVENEIIESNPFDGGKFDLATGTFVPNSTYSGYGATIK